jgi:hypothetical protein
MHTPKVKQWNKLQVLKLEINLSSLHPEDAMVMAFSGTRTLKNGTFSRDNINRSEMA